MPLGDAAVAIELGRTIDPAINARVLALDRAVAEAMLPGVVELVPTYRSLLVHYDPLVVAYEELATDLRGIVERGPNGAGGDTWLSEPEGGPRPIATAAVEVPVVYGGEWGPDLPEVARRAGLSDDEVVRRHAAGDYRVAMLGFAPGFPYLMGMDPTIACPRLSTPRVRVPAGSIGIADTQTGIYPFAMPGGWRLVGRTSLRLFDPAAEPPALLRAGANVRFVPVAESDLPAPWTDEIDRPADAAQGIRVLEPGFLATVQDAGRRGYQRYGVPPSGAADRGALAAGNAALGNPSGAAAVEITAGGAAFVFLVARSFALSGAALEARLDGRAVAPGAPVPAAIGQRLQLGRPRTGLRSYLCVSGGIDVPVVLGSRSTYLPAGFGGFGGRPLRTGDLLPVGSIRVAAGRPPGSGSPPPATERVPTTGHPASPLELPFVPSGQWEDFPATARRAFVDRRWQVSHRSDRIGLRLGGEPLPIGSLDRRFVSDGTVTGAIQVAGDGLPIVLLVDRQTTGGYPKLGAVASVALDLLGQAQPGDEVVFRPMRLAAAQQALRAPAM